MGVGHLCDKASREIADPVHYLYLSSCPQGNASFCFLTCLFKAHFNQPQPNDHNISLGITLQTCHFKYTQQLLTQQPHIPKLT